MPPELTADTGVDALTHALEAYVSIFASPYTDAFCLQAIHLILDALPRAVADGGDLARAHRHGQRGHDRRARLLERLPRRQPRARPRRRRALRRRPRPRQRRLPPPRPALQRRDPGQVHAGARLLGLRRAARSTRRSPGSSGSAAAARTPRASACSRASTSCCATVGIPRSLAASRGSRREAWTAALPDLCRAAFADPSGRTNPRMPMLAELRGAARGRLPTMRD